MTSEVAVGAHSCVINPRLKAARPSHGGKYGRMFPDLPACVVDEAAAVSLGVTRMNATLPVVDRALENPRIPAGFAVLGQFIAHDITADRSLLSRHAVTGDLLNSRVPRLDLEALYGDGPVGNPFLYDRDDPDRLLLDSDDLPRNRQGTALIGDPRNDVHLLISQLHVAFLKFHNAVVGWLRERGTPAAETFDEARRLVRWHHEWIVVHEYLPLSVGDEMIGDLLMNGRRYYEPGEEPEIPVEFADAAYRFGHAQITPTYRLNDEVSDATIFPDCLGGSPVPPERFMDWSWFFDVPGAGHAPQPSRKLVASLTHALIDLPDQIVGHTEVAEQHSLASRDLRRGVALDLPSGEAVARAMGVEPLTDDECGLRSSGWVGETPLWYYVLKEAETRADGEHLGPAGGRIVAEVLLGLLDADPGSYRSAEPGWRPMLPSTEPGRFTMGDLLRFAGAA